MLINGNKDFKRFIEEMEDEHREVFDYKALVDEFDLTVKDITSLNRFFEDTNFKEINLKGLDTSRVVDMVATFHNCTNLESVDLKSLDLSKVEFINCLFEGCSSLKEIDLSGINVNSLRSADSVFKDCENLKNVNLSNINLPKLENMGLGALFENCKSLTYVNLSNFCIPLVTYTYETFAGCKHLTQLDLSTFYAPKLRKVSRIFFDCLSLQVISLSEDLDIIRDVLESERPDVKIISGSVREYIDNYGIGSNINEAFREDIKNLFLEYNVSYSDLENVSKMMYEVVEDEDYNLDKIDHSRSTTFKTTSMF